MFKKERFQELFTVFFLHKTTFLEKIQKPLDTEGKIVYNLKR